MKKLILLFALLVLTACSPAAVPTAAPAPIAVQPASRPPEPARPAPTQPPAAPALQATVALPGDNFFQDPGVNPQTRTRQDHLSTFALDVDTASYTVARRYLRDGNLPPYEAVRVEEFVNFFRQDYPRLADVAFGIYADGAPSPFTRDHAYILRIGIQGYEQSREDRQPVHLTFAIDVSGSMEMENRLGLVKRSLRLLVDRLGPEDQVAIVVYGTDARVALHPVHGSARGMILSVIDSLSTEGSTNAEAGLRLAFQLARETFSPEAVNRVILCSDGVANMGRVSADDILAAVQEDARGEIYLSTYGFGMGNFNDVLLEQLADKGNGAYAYIDTLEEARSQFIDKLVANLVTIAKDAKAQVDFNPDLVASYRQLGYENRAVSDQDFRSDAVDGGEIGAGHSVTVLYEVHLKEEAQGRIATVQLRWQDPNGGNVQEINGNFNTWDLSSSYEETSPRYQLDVLAAQFAGLLRQDPAADPRTWSQLSRRARDAAQLLSDDPDACEFADLVDQAYRLSAND